MFTLTGKAGQATRSLIAETPQEDAKVLDIMKQAQEISSEIDKKLEEELKTYK